MKLSTSPQQVVSQLVRSVWPNICSCNGSMDVLHLKFHVILRVLYLFIFLICLFFLSHSSLSSCLQSFGHLNKNLFNSFCFDQFLLWPTLLRPLVFCVPFVILEFFVVCGFIIGLVVVGILGFFCCGDGAVGGFVAFFVFVEILWRFPSDSCCFGRLTTIVPMTQPTISIQTSQREFKTFQMN